MFLILWQGAALAVIALSAYLWALRTYGEGVHARTIALLALVSVQLGDLFNCRSLTRSAFDRFFSNPYVFAAVAVVVLLQAAAVYFRPLATVLGLTEPNINDWGVIAVAFVLPIAIVEVSKFFSRRRGPSGG
jgi:Ca2+-transporting ATPase